MNVNAAMTSLEVKLIIIFFHFHFYNILRITLTKYDKEYIMQQQKQKKGENIFNSFLVHFRKITQIF